jgi:hypothetical protein
LKDLVIGDLHFGIKTNNISWLTQQLQFVDTCVIPNIDGHQRVIFLGDLFDIRYSINTQVGCEVKKKVRKMLKQYPNVEFFFIAGNHDYFSPIVDFEEYNAYEVVFGGEFVDIYKNLHIISTVPYLDNRTLMLPWYFTEDDARYTATTKEHRGQYDIIYCHTDCEHWSADKTALKGDAAVYSGHIHYPYVNEESKLYNIGAACAFTFNDANSERYIYTIENGVITKSYENTVTPRFRRYYNERIFTLTETDINNSYTQLCISADNINKANYIEQIKQLKSTYINCNISTVVIDNNMQGPICSGVDLNTDIHGYIKNNIPEYLNEKYEILKKRIQNTD